MFSTEPSLQAEPDQSRPSLRQAAVPRGGHKVAARHHIKPVEGDVCLTLVRAAPTV